MMTLPLRQVYEDMPSVLMIPVEMRHKRVEVILFPLDDIESAKSELAVDEFGWPVGLFDKLTRGWQGEPMERAPQDEYLAFTEANTPVVAKAQPCINRSIECIHTT